MKAIGFPLVKITHLRFFQNQKVKPLMYRRGLGPWKRETKGKFDYLSQNSDYLQCIITFSPLFKDILRSIKLIKIGFRFETWCLCFVASAPKTWVAFSKGWSRRWIFKDNKSFQGCIFHRKEMLHKCVFWCQTIDLTQWWLVSDSDICYRKTNGFVSIKDRNILFLQHFSFQETNRAKKGIKHPDERGWKIVILEVSDGCQVVFLHCRCDANIHSPRFSALCHPPLLPLHISLLNHPGFFSCL